MRLVHLVVPEAEKMREVMREAKPDIAFQKWRDAMRLIIAEGTKLAGSIDGLSNSENIFGKLLAEHTRKIMDNQEASVDWAIVLRDVADAFDEMLTFAEDFFNAVPEWIEAGEQLFKDIFSNETARDILGITAGVMALNVAMCSLLKVLQLISGTSIVTLFIANPELAAGAMLTATAYYLQNLKTGTEEFTDKFERLKKEFPELQKRADNFFSVSNRAGLGVDKLEAMKLAVKELADESAEFREAWEQPDDFLSLLQRKFHKASGAVKGFVKDLAAERRGLRGVEAFAKDFVASVRDIGVGLEGSGRKAEKSAKELA